MEIRELNTNQRARHAVSALSMGMALALGLSAMPLMAQNGVNGENGEEASNGAAMLDSMDEATGSANLEQPADILLSLDAAHGESPENQSVTNPLDHRLNVVRGLNEDNQARNEDQAVSIADHASRINASASDISSNASDIRDLQSRMNSLDNRVDEVRAMRPKRGHKGPTGHRGPPGPRGPAGSDA